MKTFIPLNLHFFDESAAGQQSTGTPPVTQTANQPPAGTQTAAPGTQPPAGQQTKDATPPAAQTTTTTTQTADPKPPEKTFTQAELDFIVGERLKRAKEGAPTKEEMTAFKAWQESQKNDQQKQAELLDAEKKRADAATAQLLQLQQMESVRKLGVDESFIGYVHYEATQQSAAKNITFDEALTSFIKESKDKYKRAETRQVTVDTDAKQQPPQTAPMVLNFTGVRPRPGQTT